MQYTIRGIPPAVDDALRTRAREADTSLNEAVVDALAEGVGVKGVPQRRRDLGDVAGTWRTDKALETALEAQAATPRGRWRRPTGRRRLA